VRFSDKRVIHKLLPVLVVALLLAGGAAFLGALATQASSWPGSASTTAASSTSTTAAPTTTTTVAPAPVEYTTIEIKFDYEAGAAQYKTWTAGRVIHAGIGWFEPFGRSEYVAGIGFPEATEFPKPDFMNATWMATYKTSLFCIYMLKDGWIYAYDGVVGNLHPVENDDGKMDMLLNVIVGGTGKYKGANGMLIGRTPGRGASSDVGGGLMLPVSIIKTMDGYINIPTANLR